ncbi:MAG: hypothetical protein JWP65_148 [Ramlibacter sp.]|uniref:M10 family metallopeptidase C-terminal domain-containing protein n=1 Tax=Ramlibacter sp. TaxID=1917967 RepID=UPI00262F4C05|nr:M10 family metallopeptidase C-terminal domain-containing protein [Ramlibacter sp.]MDB5749727.1 hypothetical protein [Ramlibacter sp.]
MAIHDFSTAGSTIDGFDPDFDTLVFPADLPAAHLLLAQTATGVALTHTGKSVTLAGIDLADLGGDQLVFSDGSMLVRASGVGGVGADLLLGGAGTDSMVGGAGDDIYIVDATTDLVEEAEASGGDTVRASVGHTLTAHVENLVLTGTGALDGTGNDLDNDIVGNSAANVLSGAAGADVMTGGDGNDTYHVDDAGDLVREVSATGGVDKVIAGVDYVLGAHQESLTLVGTATGGTGNELANMIGGNDETNHLSGADGDDTLEGDAGDDSLDGGAGNDSLDGGLGRDTMVGGAGDDSYVVDDESDFVEEASASGGDTVRASVSHTLSANVENLVLTGAANIDASGNELDNLITGNSAANVIRGGGGNDIMRGGDGNDSYHAVEDGDTVEESSATGGTDTVISGRTFVLGANLENLTLAGAAAINGTGNSLANLIVGNGVANLLVGAQGNDTMEGGAGNDTLQGDAGRDRLVGDLGDDSYIVDATTDVVVEAQGEGADTVTSSATFVLGAHIEHLVLVGTGSINGTGNALANQLTGNSGANLLDGGIGSDTMTGGDGNDTYHVDVAGDSIVETNATSAGTDTVVAGLTGVTGYTLAANLENLTLAGTMLAGTGNAANNSLQGSELANTLKGLDGNDTLDGGAGADTMEGGAGNDIYVVDATGDVIVEAANGGTDTVSANISYRLGATLENLTLTGTAAVNATGNSLANVLTGNSGSNILQGGAGSDTMTGGDGNDTYYVEVGGDQVVETDSASGGVDRVVSSINYILGSHMESLTLTASAAIGTGNTLANKLVGNALANLLKGEAGNDTLDGGAGADTLKGGAGDDTYITGAGDSVTEDADAGIDTVESSVSLALGANLENLTLTGSDESNGTGNALANVLRGNGARNILTGRAGDDTYFVGALDVVVEAADGGADTVVSGLASYTLGEHLENLTLQGGALAGTGNALANVLRGNALANTLAGGEGNDTYFVDGADTIVELAAGGIDTVVTTVSYDLGAGSQLENLTLSGTTALDATGNEHANLIIGNSAASVIRGGAGSDTMEGGDGNDTYHVDDVGDLVTESAAATGGVDLVLSSLAGYTLLAHTENLTLVGGALAGIGNELANKIAGNAHDNALTGDGGNDTLDGGAGADAMDGGAGDDTYIVDADGDSITELAGGGIDTIESSIDDVLEDHQEHLKLTGAGLAGTGNELANAITGNAGANTLVGNDGNDTLDGGLGADTMTGGAGNDTYVVDTASDILVELADGGTDTVMAGLDFILQDAWENLVLTGAGAFSGTGNDHANAITGNGGANALSGGGGHDTLDGGAGIDTLVGAAGDDTYVVDVAGDVVTETAGGGVDTVQSLVTRTLGTHLENLTLIGSAAADGTGNAVDNVLRGNSGANLLRGLGGNDTMVGLEGNDTYHLEDDGDSMVEEVSGGTDTVIASFSHTLAANFENLRLAAGFAAAVDGSGNTAANEIKGNALANLLIGHGGDDTLDGGAGVDTLDGGLGHDTYVLDVAGDRIIGEVADVVQADPANNVISNDTVVAAFSHVLGEHLENLALTGNDTLAGTGNELANAITGNGAANVLKGLVGNDTLDGGAGVDLLVGSVGDDTYIVDATGDMVNEQAGEGTDTVLSSATTFTLGRELEHLTLTGSAAINGTGNTQNNRMVGNTGANVIDGGAGADTMEGGTGNDTYTVDHAGDVVTESPLTNGGSDRINASVSFVLGGFIESLTLTGVANIDGTGNSLNNQIFGNAGNNRLVGGGGSDMLFGGNGNDGYTADGNDQIFEGAGTGSGVDSVRMDASSYGLGSNLENLEFITTAAVQGAGNELANRIQGAAFGDFLDGRAGADVVYGMAGDDTIFGGADKDRLLGGAGKDHLGGGTGDDVVYGEAADDALFGGSGADTLYGGDGNDLMFADGDGLATGNTLDTAATTNLLYGGAGNDQLSGNLGIDKLHGEAGDDKMAAGAGNDLLSGGDGADYMAGGAGNDNLAGGAGKDTLDGGTGNDTMSGSLGDDTYYVDSRTDVVIEYRSSTGGKDLVAASISYLLGDYVEDLVLLGTGALAATGNALANRLFGNDGNNVLDGGIGADTLVGGKGNDTYRVDNVKDAIGEAAGGGIDTVIASTSFGLGAFLDNLTLTGTGAFTAAGNTLANTIRGNSGGNALVGGGGKDTLLGGLGKDTYYVDSDDVIIETRSADVDLVVATGSRTLGDYQENLMFQGARAYKGVGNALANVMLGGTGGDVLEGGKGGDQLLGQAGNDALHGGDGNDRLVGGLGKDMLTGGAGNDFFSFLTAADSSRANFDVITDFQRGKDRIDVSQLDANAATASIDDFTFLGEGAFSRTNAAGQIRIGYDAATGTLMVYASTDADATAEFAVQVRGVTTLSGSDFIG